MYIDLRKFKQKQNKPKNLALVHDFLIRWGGAEKVVKKLTETYPDATVFVLFYDPQFTQKHFPDSKIKASFLQRPYNLCRKISKVPFVNLSHRLLAPFFFQAAESLNLSKFNTVISSAGIVKSVITKPESTHISYVHSPIRWLWQETQIYTDDRRFRSSLINTDISELSVREALRLTVYQCLSVLRWLNPLTYLRKAKNFFARIFAHFARIADFEAAKRPDIVITNSNYSAQRIKKYYNREARVIHPPAVEEEEINARSKQDKHKTKSRTNFTPKLDEVDGSGHKSTNKQINKLTKTGYFVTASRLSDYKNVDIAIRAFNELGYNLVVIGKGPKAGELRRLAKDNIYFTGFIEKKELYKKTIKKSLGFVHPCFEDFGIAMVEALSLGVPVIAPNFGGAREIVKPGINGELYTAKQTQNGKNTKLTQNKEHETNTKPEISETSVRAKHSEARSSASLPRSRISNSWYRGHQCHSHNEIQNLADTIERLLNHYSEYNQRTIKKTAQRFTEERFVEEIKNVVNRKT